jgi:hypothetical protein
MAAPSMVADATGVPRSQETAPPWDPQVGLCLGPYGGPRKRGAFSYERGTPARGWSQDHRHRPPCTVGACGVWDLKCSPLQGYLAHKKQRPLARGPYSRNMPRGLW